MSTPAPIGPFRRTLQVALLAASVAMAIGLLMAWLLPMPAAATLVWSGLAVLVTIPVLGVVGVLIDEYRRRDWPFAAAAVAVLVVLTYTLLRKITS